MTPSDPAPRVEIYPVPISLSGSQLAIVGDEIDTMLIGLAGDLDYLDRTSDPQKFVSEVAAYARLAAAVARGTLHLPDRAAQKVLRRLSKELDDRNEYERVVAEHEAFQAFGRLLRTPPPAAGSSRGRP